MAPQAVSTSHTVQTGTVLSDGSTVEGEVEEGYYRIRNKKGEGGFCDKNGRILIPPGDNEPRILGSDRFLRDIYTYEGEHRRELLGPGEKHIADLPYGINIRGKYHDGLLRVESNYNLTGYLDLQGQFRIKPANYSDGVDFREGFAHAQINERGTRSAVVFDTNGRVIAGPFTNGAAEDFYDGVATVTVSNGKAGVINGSGRFVIPAEYQFIFRQDNYILAYKDGFWHIFTKQAKPFLDLPKSISYVSTLGTNNIWIVGTGGTPCTYTNAGIPNEGRKFGAMDTTGEIVIPIKFDYLGNFFGDIAEFGERKGDSKKLLFGVINTKGEIVNPCEYDHVYISEGHARLIKDSEIKFDKKIWDGKSIYVNRREQWRLFLKDYNLIGMKKEMLISLLGEPLKSNGLAKSDEKPNRIRYSILAGGGCGNSWQGIEIEFSDDLTVTGWRDVGFGDSQTAWNRANVVYVKQNDLRNSERLVPKSASKQYEGMPLD